MSTMHKILVVDDITEERTFLIDLLKKEYIVLEAGSYDAAFEVLRDNKDVDVIILDLDSSEQNSIILLERIKSDSSFSNIPVLSIVDEGTDELQEKAINLGIEDLIRRPFPDRLMIRRIKNIIDKVVYKEKSYNDFSEWKTLNLNEFSDIIPGGVVIFEIIEDELKVLYYNKTIMALTGYSREDLHILFKHDVLALVYEEDREYVMSEIKLSVSERRNLSCSLRLIKKDSTFRWVKLVANNYSKDGKTIFNSVFIDISNEKDFERRSMTINEQLRFRAEHDMLTGLYNKEKFSEETRKMFKSCPDRAYLLVRWNFDRFKLINDILGKESGDILLKYLAVKLNENFKGKGIYCRLESDNFALCCPSCDFDAAEMQHTIDRWFKDLKWDYPISISLGIYMIDDINIPVDQMYDRANLALQTIKGNYTVRYAFYNDQMRISMLREQQIISEMKTAVKEKQFVIYLQPVYSLAQKELISAEALVRWIHPEKGYMAPDEFIPLFEKNGFITDLDYYVWESVCKYQRERIDRKLPNIPISLNISRRSLYNVNLSADIIKLALKYDIDPSFLKFEITESAYTDSPEQLLITIKKLQAYGFNVLMDDFGSGYSSLNMLKDIPVDILKIDLKFLGGFETSSRAGNILTSVVRMAKWIKVPVIAEGVETKNQTEFLRSIGCDSIQGYYFSKPLSVAEFEKLAINSFPVENIEIHDSIDVNEFDMLFNGNLITNKLFNSIVGGIGIYELTEARLDVIRVNDGYFDTMGYTPQSFYNDSSNVFDRVHPDDREILINACRKAVKDGGTEKITLRRNKSSGRIIWLEVHVRCLIFDSTRPLICLAVNDISLQHQHESELKEQREKLQRHHDYLELLYDAVPCAIVQFSVEENPKLIKYNEACWRIFKFASSEDFEINIFSNMFSVIYPDDKKLFMENFKKVLKTKETAKFEMRALCHDGSLIYVQNMIGLARTPSGEIIVQDVFTDITEIKNAEAAKNLHKYSLTLFSVFDEIFELNYNNNTLSVVSTKNKTTLKQKVIPADYAFSYWINNIVHSDYRDELISFIKNNRFIEQSIENGIPNIEYRLNTESESWFSTTFLQVSDNDYLICNNDISDKKLVEKVLKEKLQRTEAQLNFFSDRKAERKTVLIVDDSEINRAILKNMLEDKYVVNEACNGREAIDYLDSNKNISAILLDIIMPEMDGYEFLRIAKADPALLSIPIVVLTDADNQNIETDCLQLGAHDFLRKPYNPITLRQRLGNLIDLCDTNAHRAVMDSFINNLPGGVAVYEIGDGFCINFVSDGYAKMNGYSKDDFMDRFAHRGLDIVCEEDREDIKKAVSEAASISAPIDVEFRDHQKDGFGWLHLQGIYSFSNKNSKVYYFIATDITKLKEQKKNTKIKDEIYDILLGRKKNILFKYFYATDRMEYFVCTPDGNIRKEHIDNYLNNLKAESIIHPDSFDKFLNTFRKLEKSENCIEIEYLANYCGSGMNLYRSWAKSRLGPNGKVSTLVGHTEYADSD